MKHTLQSDAISAIITADGAELCSLKNSEGLELLWQAGPAWPRHAPILFPIVGRLKNDEMRSQGKTYPMTQHGFARDRTFEWRERSPKSCTLVLTDDQATRLHFPYAFRLAVTYAVEGAHLDVAFEITNTGDEILPASLGAHPAFNWPLLPGLPKEAYGISFSHEEAEPIRRLKDGLLRHKPEPTPIKGKFLALSEQLFADDAVILDRLASTSIRYGANRGPSISISWQGFRELGMPKEAYGISFSHEEAEPIRRLKDGLLRHKPEPTPIKGKFLALSEQLFADDAVILDRLASTSIRYGANRGPSISISWQGFRELGIWSKPQGAPFLCIEPWHGFASPSDFDGDFLDKPGIMKLARAATQILKYRIGVG